MEQVETGGQPTDGRTEQGTTYEDGSRADHASFSVVEAAAYARDHAETGGLEQDEGIQCGLHDAEKGGSVPIRGHGRGRRGEGDRREEKGVEFRRPRTRGQGVDTSDPDDGARSL